MTKMDLDIWLRTIIMFLEINFYILTDAAKTEEIAGIDMSHIKHRKREVEQFGDESLPMDTLQTTTSKNGVHNMLPGTDKMLLSPGKVRLEIFCYSGEPKHLLTILKTVELVVKVPEDNYQYFEGSNASSIRDQYNDASWFSFSPWKPGSFRLSIYNVSCIGISTSETFRASLKVRYLDLWRVLALIAGLALFLMAPLLAHNIAFHYMTGVSVGVFGSLLVIVYILSRYVPKKFGAIGFLIGGWGLILYLVQYLWLNFVIIVKEYHTVVVGYVVIAGLISFAIVYRWGPVQDERSLKLVQWSLQLFGLVVVFVSSQYKEFTLALVLILLTNYNFPSAWKLRLRSYWLRHFPPKKKLLSDEEYLEQGRVETEKALNELREFCHSPKCNAWKTMSALRSPQRSETIPHCVGCGNRLIKGKRFAEFVDGSSHLTDDEILSYESANNSRSSSGRIEEDWMTDDEEQDHG